MCFCAFLFSLTTIHAMYIRWHTHTHTHTHLQHPFQASVVCLVNTLKVIQGNRVAKKLLVEGKSEASIDVEAMKHSHAQHTTNKVKIRQMLLWVSVCVCVCVRERERERERESKLMVNDFRILSHRIDSWVWVDLQCVDIIPWVLEQAIVRIEHFMREEIDPLPSNATIVQPILSTEPDVKLFLKISNPHLHYLPVRLLKHIRPGHFNSTVASCWLHCMELGSHRLHFVDEVSARSRGWGQEVKVWHRRWCVSGRSYICRCCCGYGRLWAVNSVNELLQPWVYGSKRVSLKYMYLHCCRKRHVATYQWTVLFCWYGLQSIFGHGQCSGSPSHPQVVQAQLGRHRDLWSEGRAMYSPRSLGG